MKVAVTGGAGFIGSHLVDALLGEGNEIVVLDNFSTGRPENIEHIESRIEVVECDLAVSGSWTEKLEGVDHVFHLAALADIVPSIQQPEAYFRANVDGTFNVLTASQKASAKRFIYAASSSSYGIPDFYPTSENAPIRPQYPYALTKYMGEELVMHWAKVYRLSTLSLRFFNVYGPRSRTTGTYGAVFGVFLAQKLAGKPFTIVGNGEQTRDFVHVCDVADANILLAESDATGVYNVGTGVEYSVNQIADMISDVQRNISPRVGEARRSLADSSKLRSLGWKPKVKLEDWVNA